MKIVAVLGSPRPNGNSALLAKAFLEVARERGADIEVYRLNQMNIKGCQGCGKCKTDSEVCVVEDDLAPVYDAVRQADLLVLASPVYFGDLSGQLKCFWDRTYAFANPDFSSRLAPGKKTVMLLAQGAPAEEMFNDIHPRYERWLKMFGFVENHLVRAVGVQGAGEVKNQPETLAQARELARRLVR
ncbi:MAG: flavodoxin family protein [Desulfobaccales bacterium]